MSTAPAVMPKSKCFLRKTKLLNFYDGQYQFKVLFKLYAEFESILKPVNEWYRKNMNQTKTEQKGKTSVTETISAYVPS